jgi:hypothetical protein
MIKAKSLWYINALLLFVAIFIAYQIWFAPRKDAWNFIPENAFLVVESSEIQQSLFNKTAPDSTQLADVPFFYDALAQLSLIVQSIDNEAIAKKFLEKKLITYSLHRENKKNLEYVVYIPTNTFGDSEFLNKLTVPDATKRKVYGRNYKGFRINELYNNNSTLVFNFFIYDDFLICSGSKILLEEVANRIKSGVAIERVPFRESRKGIAHIYFKSRSLQDVADILPSQLSPNLIEFFGNITPRNPDIVFEKQKTPNILSAYIHSKGTNNIPFLGIFGRQKPQPFTCTDLIPENTAITFRMSFRNKLLLAQDFNNYLRTNEQDLVAEKDSVNRLLNANINSFYSILKNEVVLCEMETSADEPSKKILLIKTEDSADALNLFDDLASNAEKISSYFKPKPFTYLNYYVRKIEVSQLPAMLFGSVFRGFSDCYYTLKDDYIILASDDIAMREYLNNLNTGQTWAKSSIYRNFIKKLSPNAQVTAIISPQRVWNNIYYSLPKKWQATTLKHEARTKDLRFIAVENFVIKSTFGTKFLIEKVPQTQKEKLINKLFLQDSLSTSVPFVGIPNIIKNPISAADEIIIQQSDNQVLLLSNNAKEINKIPINQPINTSYLLPTDYFQNGLLQYVTNSPNDLVVLSRDAQKGITASAPELSLQGNIKSLAVNEIKIYVADQTGSIYIINEETQKVTKVKTPTILTDIVQIQPVKFKNNNYLAVLQKDGTLSVIYEQGPNLSGFPKVPLTARPVGMIVEEDKDKNSVITLLSEIGEIKKVSMTGNIQNETNIQLERPDKATVFELLFDQNHKDWFVVRRTPTSLVVFNKQGQSVIRIESTNFMKSQLKYFDLGNDLRVIVVFDGKNNTLFDLKGNTIGDKPLQASSLPAISYAEAYNKLFIYNPNKTRFEVWSVKLK